MKKYLPLLLLLGMGSVVHAGGLSTRHSTSLQYSIDGGHTEYTRMGNSYSISGTNVTTTHTPAGDGASAVTGGLGVNAYSASTGVGTVGTITAGQGTTNGTGSFSFAQSWTIGDIAGTGSDHTDFGNVTTHAAGTAMGTAAAPGTITSAHVTTIAGNGTPGSTTTSQFVTEITAF